MFYPSNALQNGLAGHLWFTAYGPTMITGDNRHGQQKKLHATTAGLKIFFLFYVTAVFIAFMFISCRMYIKFNCSFYFVV